MNVRTSLVVTALLASVPALAQAEKTCGQMIAEKAVLPEAMSKLMLAITEMMEAHAKFMLEGKPSREAKMEAKAVQSLAKQHRSQAAAFVKTAAAMKGLAELPGAPHDMAKMMADPRIQASMKELLATQRVLVALLQKEVAEMSAQGGKK